MVIFGKIMSKLVEGIALIFMTVFSLLMVTFVALVIYSIVS